MNKILVVDDDEALVKNLESALKKEGFEVFTAENGAMATQVLGHNKPDFILLDLIMPVMDGVEFLKEVETLYPDLISKIMIMTNADDNAHIAEVMSHGVTSYVNKSTTDLQKLVEMVKERMK